MGYDLPARPGLKGQCPFFNSFERSMRKIYIVLIISYNIMKQKRVIMKVWKNRIKNQKLVTIPKDCDIEEGDYVEIKKVK